MTLSKLVPVLRVYDLRAALDFYVSTLGFSCANQSDEWASLECGDVEIMLSLPNAHVPMDKPIFTGSLYLRTSEVDAWWNRLKDKAKIVYPIENFFYGMREFAIEDNNGYCLQFGQEIEDPSQIPSTDQA